MKKFILFAAAAAMFAACANENDLVLTQQQAANETDANLISFDAYTMRSTTTRAGEAGLMQTSVLEASSSTSGGFGVFAYYTDNFDYTPLYVPNFMYNERVYRDGDKYTYALPKYWPNEHGSQAVSTDQDRISFFAYAPYVDVDPSTGMLTEGGSLLDASDEKLQWGITGMKRNTLQGDPIIQYITSFDQAKSVDLCWATTGAADITWNTNNTTQKIAKGYPWLNVRKPDGVVGDGAKVKFNFQHATAQLLVTVRTDNTGGWLASDDPGAAATKVWVRSIRFTGITHKAALNLNNPKTATVNKARWMDYYGTNELELGESVTVHDGRKDGSEGVAEAVAPNESVLGLNPQLIQNEGQIESNAWITGGSERTGVTSEAQKLFCNGSSAATSPIFVIPTGEKVNVEIVYDIETIDTKLPTLLSDGETPGSTIENRITKTITFGPSTQKLENGKSYTLNLILGLKDVQFTATVNESWDEGGSSDTYLPLNAPAYAAGVETTLEVPCSATTIDNFTVTGLTANGAVTTDRTGIVTAAIGAAADADGKLTITGISLDGENETVKNRTGSITVTDATPEPDVVTTINVTQAAKPFVLKQPITVYTTSFEIEAGDGSGTVDFTESSIYELTIQKWNSSLSKWDDMSTTQYGLTNAADKITVNWVSSPVTAGDKIIIKITVGNTAEVISNEITVTEP